MRDLSFAEGHAKPYVDRVETAAEISGVLPAQAIGKAPDMGRGPMTPAYLESVYWWAYLHPRGIWVFERQWLVNAILFGNYARLCDAALDALGERLPGLTIQIACAYG
ncbi:MAG TPA: hypothetical protein VKG91_04565, partial [Roseiarcus sp.]|nr:hypothetical protein [Roseiarcus sp.]